MITIIFLRKVSSMVGYLLGNLEELVPIFQPNWNDDLSFSFRLKIMIHIKKIWLAIIFLRERF